MESPKVQGRRFGVFGANAHWSSDTLEFALCRECGRDAFSLYHFGWTDDRMRAHDFDARDDKNDLQPARYSVPIEELPW
jgi:hypothetical protein